MKNFKLLLVLILWQCLSGWAQNLPLSTPAKARMNAYQRDEPANKYLQNLKFQSVGPTIMGGRVVDVSVNPADPSIFMIAYASGGLWITENDGQSYSPLFDNQMTLTIGDIAVDWERKSIWIGTGENNSSRSSYAGVGMYQSLDEGKTWTHKGLEESHHIGRVILHPTDPNILWVASVGHLYSDNAERGIYKTTDGGETWNQTLFVDDKTGAIDLILDPSNPKTLYASMWHRERKAWDFTEGGLGTGIYKSTDGGETWALLTGPKSGFALGENLGRIGLAISHQKPSTLYAMLDNQTRREKEEKKEEGLDKKELKEMSAEDFLALDDQLIKAYLKDHHFPKKYTVDSVKAMVRLKAIEPKALAIYTEDANSQLFDTEVVGAEVYQSIDGGLTWSKTHEGYLDDLVHSYGYYFGQIRVSPIDDQKVYLTGVPLIKSIDGGKTFKSVNGDNQHVDHHVLWINPKNDQHLINGNDGGISISRDEGAHWMKVNSPPVGQFYAVNVDYAKPYRIYGGLQDNGVWQGPSNYKEGVGWQYHGKYPYHFIMGGDGFKIEIDRRDNETVYTGYQFGNYYRFRVGGRKTKVTPKHDLGESPLRFNWQTPIHLSLHNQDIFYIGSNKFHRSLNRGDDYDLVSKDLTKGGKKGDVAFGTLTYIHESPLVFGKIYVGSDDGLIHRTDDLGYHWKNISKGLPEDLWVSCVQASRHDTNRVYVSLNGMRFDHFQAHIFVSDNGGGTWEAIGKNLPYEPVNVLKEDPENENILYLGTDHGLYISLNRGLDFEKILNGIPSVAVHDLVIQEKEDDLIVGTHGRSIFKADIQHLQEMDEKVMKKGIHLFKISSIKYNANWGKQYNKWNKPSVPELVIPVFVGKEGICKFSIYLDDLEVYQFQDTLLRGLNEVAYGLAVNEEVLSKYEKKLKKGKENITMKKSDVGKYFLRPGDYSIKATDEAGNVESKKFKIESNEKN